MWMTVWSKLSALSCRISRKWALEERSFFTGRQHSLQIMSNSQRDPITSVMREIH